MTQIITYQQNYDGSHTIVIDDAELDDKTTLLLDNNVPVNVKLDVLDIDTITDKQRRKIFALVNDIEDYTGQPREYMRYMFQDYVRFIYGYDKQISLSSCSMKVANQIIEVILNWVALHDVPLNYRTSELLRGDKTFLYLNTLNRKCVICGKPNSDLAHFNAVGRGRNRNKIDHTDNKVLALCRNHHTEQHTIGMDSFNKKYHLEDSWVQVDERLNRMLRGGKNG
ncbi:putative HNHc nuclease [Mammaliicoccus sciuri]|uniref:putative HNHc nuclease n=1 Tax=Mammaliicoccus sciuri TaxID=1296 RepID=UPI0021D0ED0F|nr:putative HNHc nuclease [Mammaliicoccus sciuri]UXU83318.1 putative HNHc nuclease [Mammaliicoccus sciuri]UXU93165.1 putative HNHc nuclease [Mammaliicoccus sciuri]UXV15115.1 putative HNHc nuclease [Mammaliicoccus sciuri]UXV23378.1 putative HNHc nuclease [Mammaliicoccus sciuri]UXV26156.1 putative HNHc nuclease [Mammaliicoccus sciuri]